MLGLCAACAAGCGPDEEILEVRLRGDTVAVTPGASSGPGSAVRFVYAGVLSPERSALPYARFASFVTGRLHRPVEVVRRRTHAELNELLRTGNAEAGLICAGAYAVGREQFGLRLLVVPTVDDKVTYQAYLVTRRDRGRARLEDLRGAVFAFSDPLSNSGYRWVAAELHARGTTPEAFFGRTFFTYSHDNTLAAVRDGIADAGAVHSAIWDQLRRESAAIEEQLEVIERSEEFPVNPVVASPRMPEDDAELLTRVLLDMANAPDGREILADLGITGFVRLSDSVFDPIARSWRELGVLPPRPPTAP